MDILDQARTVINDCMRRTGVASTSKIFELGEGRLCVQGSLRLVDAVPFNNSLKVTLDVEAEGKHFTIVAFGMRAQRVILEHLEGPFLIQARRVGNHAHMVLSADLRRPQVTTLGH